MTKSPWLMPCCREKQSHRKSWDRINPGGPNLLPSVQNICENLQRKLRRNVRTSLQYYYDAWALNVINYCLCSTLMVCHFSREKHSFGNVWKHFSFWNKQSTQLVFILTKTNNSSSELSHFKLVYRDQKKLHLSKCM